MDASRSKKAKLDQAASFALGFEVSVDDMEEAPKRLEESGEMDRAKSLICQLETLATEAGLVVRRSAAVDPGDETARLPHETTPVERNQEGYARVLTRLP